MDAERKECRANLPARGDVGTPLCFHTPRHWPGSSKHSENRSEHGPLMKPSLHIFWFACLALLLLCAGCNDDQRLVSEVRRAATAQQWHSWAAEVLARSKTNSVPVPRSEWPTFVQQINAPCAEWQLITGRNGSSSNISLVSLGGFCSYGIDVGGPTFVEPPNSNQHCTKIYPGVYVVGN